MMPQPPGPARRSAGLRASGATHEGPQWRPGGEDPPPEVPFCAPPAQPSEAPAREADK